MDSHFIQWVKIVIYFDIKMSYICLTCPLILFPVLLGMSMTIFENLNSWYNKMF